MSSGLRIVLLVAAVVVVVAVFLVVRPADEGRAPQTSQPAPAERPAKLEDRSRAEKNEVQPGVTRIDIVAGEPQGGVAEIEVNAGDTVMLKVTADAPEEIHIHGYDLMEDVGPDREAAFSFDADLEGIYEVELEQSATPIAELRVNP